MGPLAIVAVMCMPPSFGMFTHTFLQTFDRLGLVPWDGIQQDIAWGHTTSLMGLQRPSIDGPIFVYRVPCQFGGGQAPRRIRVMTTTTSGPEPIVEAIAGHFEDLADPGQVEPWRLIPIDTTRGRSRNRELYYPCYILVDFCVFRSFGERPHGLLEMVFGQDEFSFPTILPPAINMVVLGDFLAPLLPLGLQGLQWQAWLNGELLTLSLVMCPEGFFLQVQVWCSPWMMQNMVAAAPLITTALHVDQDVMPDTSLVRVTTYIPGGDTLVSSRLLTVTCMGTVMETFLLGELRRRLADLRPVGFHILPVHPAASWNDPRVTMGKEKMVLVYEDATLQTDAVVFLRLQLPPFFGEGAIYCPRSIRKRDLIAQLGLQTPCGGDGEECMCYVNGLELSSFDREVDDGGFIWCLHSSPDMGREIEILSVASPSHGSVEEDTGPTLPLHTEPQGLIGSGHYCPRT